MKAITATLHEILSLHRALRQGMRERWNRDLPFEELLSDRWERARSLGFGEGTSIYHNSYVYGDVKVGRNTWIGPFTLLDGGGGLTIGDFCSIAAGVQIYTHDSVKWAVSRGKMPYEKAPVKIHDCCHIGANSIIAKGVEIGPHSVVSAGSFVRKTVPPYTIVSGVPAKVIGSVHEDSKELHIPRTDEEWWYQLMCALTNPKMIRVSLSQEGEPRTRFALPGLAYTKDFDDLVLDDEDGDCYLAGGLTHGTVLSLLAGQHYHYGNSGIMYATAEDATRVSDARNRYYKRLRYILETAPDVELRHHGSGTGLIDIETGKNGSVLSFSASGWGFITANVYLDGRTVNGMGLGIYRPDKKRFSTSSNMHPSPTNMIPLPKGYNVQLHVTHADGPGGFSYYKVHHVPDWW